MKQINIINAYLITDKLAQKDNLTISGKWIIYKLRKELSTHYDFYIEESKKLLDKYETVREENALRFKSVEEANEYQAKQLEIDNFEVEIELPKQKCKLSDIPDITVNQMESLQNFIEFTPE